MINYKNLNNEDLSSVTGGSMLSAQVIYRCKKGDTIVSLARKYGVTEKELVEANGISDVEKDLNGMKIIIP